MPSAASHPRWSPSWKLLYTAVWRRMWSVVENAGSCFLNISSRLNRKRADGVSSDSAVRPPSLLTLCKATRLRSDNPSYIFTNVRLMASAVFSVG